MSGASDPCPWCGDEDCYDCQEWSMIEGSCDRCGVDVYDWEAHWDGWLLHCDRCAWMIEQSAKGCS